MLKVTSRGVPETFLKLITESLSEYLGPINLVDQNFTIESDIHIELDFDNLKSRLIGKFNVLILSEPSTVVPGQYRKSVLNRFDLVIPAGQIRANKLGIKSWAPNPYNFKIQKINNELRTEELVMINAAKFSANKNSLYGLRRSVSKELNLRNIGYKLVGENWRMPKTKELRERIWAVRKEVGAGNFPHLIEAFSNFFYNYPEYIGRVDNKINELTKYKYALIIENEADYISEKLFDAICAGCVPVYIGHDLSSFKKLSRCVIQIEPKVNEIINFFMKDNNSLYKEKKDYIDNLDNYLSDINIFSPTRSAKKISGILVANFKKSNNSI